VSESEISNKKQEKAKERIKTRSQTQITDREILKTISVTQSATVSVQHQQVEEDIEEQDAFSTDDEMADNNMLPNFSGCENVEEWMHSLYNYAIFKKFDEPTRAAFFKLKLTGLAKTWLEGLEEEISANPDELFKQFKERFQTTDIVKQKKIRDIFTVKQQPYESVDTYVGRISTIAQQCGLSEELVINAVSLGLKPAIAAFVMENNPTTINDVVKYARTAEITRQGTVESTEALNDQIISLGQQLTEMNNKISQLKTAAVVEGGMSVRRASGNCHVRRYRTKRNRRQGRKKTYKAIIRQTTATNENGNQIQHNQAAGINVITTKSEQKVDQNFVQTL
jgi:hypothetical protein